MVRGGCVASSCITVLLVLLTVCISLHLAKTHSRDRFYTEHGQEEPTRSYTPYTGTVPLGYWGTLPWAEAVPCPRGGENRCAASLWDVYAQEGAFCGTCGGPRRYHASIQGKYPHAFAAATSFDLLQ